MRHPGVASPLRVLRVAVALIVTALGATAANSDNRIEHLIVKMRNSDASQTLNTDHRQALEARCGTRLATLRTLANGAQLLKLPQAIPEQEAEALAAAMRTDPTVEYAELDSRRYATATPDTTEPLYSQQWYLFATPGGMYLPVAWDAGVGSSSSIPGGVIVAVIDSGYRPHVELSGRILPGYDFISDTFTANDGGGRDSNALDPGDWVTSTELTAHPDCVAKDNSSWHGTFIAGMIAASGDNLQGIAGINGQARILPVRVLGKCGGVISDITDGMRWAAGLPVSGVSNNPYPAKIINLSVDGTGTCSNTEQAAINAVTAAGVTVVVAAGNDSGNVANYSPANCNGVITVAATTINGILTSYTNTGSKVAISAPGGEYYPDEILSTSNTGVTGPGSDNYVSYIGTSFATAAVSGVASLILTVRPELTPADVRTVLTTSATQITDSACNGGVCGAGIVNAGAAVSAAQIYVAPPPSGGGGGGSSDLLSLIALLSTGCVRRSKK